MSSSLRAVLLASAALVAPAVGQPAAPSKPPAAPAAVYFPFALERFAAGKPIPLVAVSIGDAMGRPQPPLDLEGKSLKDALHAIADAYSDRVPPDESPTRKARYEAAHETLALTALPSVWTIARDHQWEINDHPNVPDVLEAVDPGVLLTRLVNSLSDAQLQKASAEGLQLDDFSSQQQAVVRAAFRAPVTLYTIAPGPSGSRPRQTRDYDGVVPAERCRLWLNLAFDQLIAPKEPAKQPSQTLYTYELDQIGKMVSVERNPAAPRGYTFSLLTSVPAMLKPGDVSFDDKAFDAPIGVAGVLRLDKAVESAAKATGLALRVDPRYAGQNVVFIGDAKLRTGDVLRAMAYDVQGAWRRVGDAVLLTYGRSPLVPILAKWREQLAALDEDRDELLDRLLGPRPANAGTDGRLLANLGPSPNGPPGPTAEQIRALQASEEPPSGPMPLPGLKYADLTPEQQASVLERLRTNTRYDSPDPDSPIGQQVLQNAVFNGFRIRMALDVPDLGRYKVQNLFLSVSPTSRWMLSPGPAANLNPTPAAESSIVIPAKSRGLAVPPLSRSEWPRLFAQMRRKGISTLYLPVLWDGYTLYPSRQFPLWPGAKGRDVLADVLALAAGEKVKVVALLHTLAWRHPGGGDVHWLRKHAELVDRDVTGQGRRDWTNAHMAYLAGHRNWDYGHLFQEDPFIFSDMVRPADPTVKARLLGVLDELKAYGVSGVAFAAWARVSSPHYLGYLGAGDQGILVDGPPLLGFIAPERAAFIKEHSIDPSDLSRPGLSPVDIPSFSGRMYPDGVDDAWARVRLNEDTALLNVLADQAGKTWPGQVSLFSPLELSTKDETDAMPKGVASIRSGYSAYLGSPLIPWFAPAPDLLEGLPDEDGKVPDRVKDFVLRVGRLAEIQAHMARPLNDAAVLDFRAAPGFLWDGLALLANAGAEIKMAEPEAAAAGKP